MLAAIRAAIDAGTLQLPSDRSPTLWSNVFRQLYERRWSVNPDVADLGGPTERTRLESEVDSLVVMVPLGAHRG
jgi:hypothetical protein